jgi:hypothetical protein
MSSATHQAEEVLLHEWFDYKHDLVNEGPGVENVDALQSDWQTLLWGPIE